MDRIHLPTRRPNGLKGAAFGRLALFCSLGWRIVLSGLRIALSDLLLAEWILPIRHQEPSKHFYRRTHAASRYSAGQLSCAQIL